MKRILVVIVVLMILVSAAPSLAQGDDLTQTYTSEDGRLTFNYPEGWFVHVDEEQQEISVSNVDEFPGDLVTVVPAGQVSVAFLVGVPEEIATLSGIAVPTEASAEFLAGFWTGFYSLANLFASAFSDSPAPIMTIGELESVEINGETAAIVSLEIEDTSSILIITYASNEQLLRTVLVASTNGEMDDYRETVLAITGSIVFTP